MRKTRLFVKVTGAFTWWGGLLFHNAALYFAKMLAGFKRRQVWVEIRMVKGLQQKEKCKGMARRCSPRKYLIQLDSRLGSVAAVRTLAHEMIHVNQWLTGKMEDLNRREQVRWGKKLYDPYRLAYRKHPWEREAYRFDRVLGDKFMKFWRQG